MLNCNEIEIELSAYRDGALPPPDRANVETHLADCASCKATLAAIEKARASLMALPKLKSPASLRAKVRDQINTAPKIVSAPFRPVARVDQIRNIPWVWACGMAAALAVSLMGYVTFFRPQVNTTTPTDELALKLEPTAKDVKKEALETRKEEPLRKSGEALQRVDRLEETSKDDKAPEAEKAAAPKKQNAPLPTQSAEKRALAQDRDAVTEKAAAGIGGNKDLAGAASPSPNREVAPASDKLRFGAGAGEGGSGSSDARRRQLKTDAAPEGAEKPGSAVLKKAAPAAPPAPPAALAPVAAAAMPSKALKDGKNGADGSAGRGKGESANDARNRAAANAQDAVGKPAEQAKALGAAIVERKNDESDKKNAAPFKDIAIIEQLNKLGDDKPAAGKSGDASEKSKTTGAPSDNASPRPIPNPALASGGAVDGNANGIQRGMRKDPLVAQQEMQKEAENRFKGALREKAPQTIVLHTSDMAALREKIKVLAEAKKAVIASDANAASDKSAEKAEKSDQLGTHLSLTVDASGLDDLLNSLAALQNTAAPKEAADPAAAAAPGQIPAEAKAESKKVARPTADPKVTIRIEIVLDK